MKTINIYTIKEAEKKLTELTGNESKIEVKETTTSNIFNSDSKTVIPSGYTWTIEEHKKGGDIDLTKIVLYLEKEQESRYLSGDDLRKKLKNKKVLNANVLDYLLAHTELIPEQWKGTYVCFWGTIYRASDGILYVRYLDGDGSGWGWFCHWLGSDFSSNYPAALAS